MSDEAKVERNKARGNVSIYERNGLRASESDDEMK